MESLPLSSELLAYYKSRVDKHEKEKKILFQDFDKINLRIQEIHELNEKLRSAEKKISDLEEHISHVKSEVHYERERANQLETENKFLRVQEVEDRKKIRTLLILTSEKGETPPNFDDDDDNNYNNSNHDETNTNNQQNPWKLKCEAVQKELEELKKTEKDRRASLEESREGLTKAIREQSERYDDHIQKIENQLVRAREQMLESTQSYHQIHENSVKQEQKTKEEMEKMKQDLSNATKEVDEIRHRSQLESQVILENAKRASEEYAELYKTQLLEKDEMIRRVQDEKEQQRKKLINQMQDIESEQSKVIRKYNALVKRREYDLEGFSNDINILKKHMNSIDSRFRRLLETGMFEILADQYDGLNEEKSQFEADSKAIYSKFDFVLNELSKAKKQEQRQKNKVRKSGKRVNATLSNHEQNAENNDPQHFHKTKM